MKISPEDVVQVIKKAGTQIDFDQLDENAMFTDIGADSLDMMSIFLGLQELMDHEIPDNDVVKLGSIKEVCEYFNG